MPVVALSIEFCNRLTRTWTHVEDLVWSRYRHRIGMRAAGVMWLPRTHPFSVHYAQQTSDEPIGLLCYIGLQPSNGSHVARPLRTPLGISNSNAGHCTVDGHDRQAVRYTLRRKQGPPANGCSDRFSMIWARSFTDSMAAELSNGLLPPSLTGYGDFLGFRTFHLALVKTVRAEQPSSLVCPLIFD